MRCGIGILAIIFYAAMINLWYIRWSDAGELYAHAQLSNSIPVDENSSFLSSHDWSLEPSWTLLGGASTEYSEIAVANNSTLFVASRNAEQGGIEKVTIDENCTLTSTTMLN